MVEKPGDEQQDVRLANRGESMPGSVNGTNSPGLVMSWILEKKQQPPFY